MEIRPLFISKIKPLFSTFWNPSKIRFIGENDEKIIIQIKGNRLAGYQIFLDNIQLSSRYTKEESVSGNNHYYETTVLEEIDFGYKGIPVVYLNQLFSKKEYYSRGEIRGILLFMTPGKNIDLSFSLNYHGSHHGSLIDSPSYEFDLEKYTLKITDSRHYDIST